MSLLHICDCVLHSIMSPILLTAISGMGPGTVEAAGECLQK